MQKLIIALDLSEKKDALSLVKELKGTVDIFKVGKQLFTKYGPDLVREIQDLGANVFLDLKFHDIPNTVGHAAEMATELGVFMFNVHAMGGSAMMKSAQNKARETAERIGREYPLLIAVTVLTSMSGETLQKELWVNQSCEEYVAHLANLAQVSGLQGVVASSHEIAPIRQACGKDFIIVTPGIRPKDSALGDQTRVMTPKEAIDLGANYLVMGRPVLEAKDRKAAVCRILEECAS